MSFFSPKEFVELRTPRPFSNCDSRERIPHPLSQGGGGIEEGETADAGTYSKGALIL